MALRFRDLVAKTIKEHVEIIHDSGYVWWGWWNKPDEKIPRATFTEFGQAIAEDGPLQVYLVDSGNQRLFKAGLSEIKMSNGEDLIECPEKAKTPTYYSASKYKVWFKLSDIEAVFEDEIRKWAYDEIKDFIDDPYGSRFQDKRVYNIKEMLDRRHRTIYFIRPYDEKQNRDYLIQLVPSASPGFVEISKDLSAKLVLPTEVKDFMTTPIYRDSTYILHLSDLHFCQTHHNFPLSASRTDRPLVNILEQDIKELGYGTSPAAVVITGDLTWQGKKDEFELAYKFIATLQTLTNLEPQHVVIIPGNHDIAWGKQDNDEYDPEKQVTEPPEEAERNYKEFFAKTYGFPPNEFLSIGRRYILRNFTAVDIVGLNSSRLEQKHFGGYGFVGIPQLDSVAEGMNWGSPHSRTNYRILALHHHLMPVTAQEQVSTYDVRYSLTLDSGQLAYRALEQGIDLVAHGHMHQPFASSLSRATRTSKFPSSRSFGIHGAGSAGARREDLGAIGKNSYSIYEFDKAGLTVRVRAMSEDFSGFEDNWTFRFRSNPDGGLELEPQTK